MTDDDGLDAGGAHADTGTGGPSLLLSMLLWGTVALLFGVVVTVLIFGHPMAGGPMPLPVNPNDPRFYRP